MIAFVSIALLTSTSHAQREQAPIEQPDLVKLLAMLAFATNPTSDVVRFRRSALTPSRSATTGMQGWGGATNEHGHTRVLNLDIPAEISDSPASDLGDDLDEDFTQPDQLSDAPGSSSNPTEEDAREAWASQSKKNRFRFPKLDEVKSFDTAKAAWIKQMDKKGSRYRSKDAARAAYIAKVFEPIVQAAEPVPVEKEKAAWIGQMTQEGKRFQSADEAKAAWIAQMDKKNKFGTQPASKASTMDEAKAAWIAQMSKKGRSFTSPYEATDEYVSKVFEPVVASVPAVPLDQAKAAWIKQMSKKGKKYTSVDEAKAAWIAQMDAKKSKLAPPQQAASAKAANTDAGRHIGSFPSTGTGKQWWR